MNVLALDLGTKTGYCHTTEAGGGFIAGTAELAGAKEVAAWGRSRMVRRRDPRIRRLVAFLQGIKPQPDLVVFEDVEFLTYRMQAHLWASFRTAAWLAFPEATQFECVSVSALKKFATGFGGAKKDLMLKYLLRRYPECATFGPLDDNAVDAIWIYKWAEINLSRMPQRR